MKRIGLTICFFLRLSLLSSGAHAVERLVVADAPTLFTGLVGIVADKGYFAEQGLAVDIKEFKAGDDASRAGRISPRLQRQHLFSTVFGKMTSAFLPLSAVGTTS